MAVQWPFLATEFVIFLPDWLTTSGLKMVIAIVSTATIALVPWPRQVVRSIAELFELALISAFLI